MKILNTILLIITTIIALFFFGKWVNDVRPRYETVYSFETGDYNLIKNLFTDEMYYPDCEDGIIGNTTVEIPVCYFEDNEYGEGFRTYEIEYFYANNCDIIEKKIDICFTEEKVRIN